MGRFEQFKKEFTQAGMTVEGSGWAALTYDPLSKRLLIMQIEKHNKYLQNIWNILNWQEVEKRYREVNE